MAYDAAETQTDLAAYADADTAAETDENVDPDGGPRRERRVRRIRGRKRPAAGNGRPGSPPPVAYVAAAGIVLVVVAVAVATVVLLGHDDGPTTGSAPAVHISASGAAPSAYSYASSTPVFAPIAKRAADPRPLTVAEVFDTKTIKDGHARAALKLTASKLDGRCTDAAWGARFAASLTRAGCGQVIRGVFTGRRFAAMVTIFNLADSSGADRVVADADPRAGKGFAQPLPDGPSFGQGFSSARGLAMGHYAAITWVRRTDGTGAETDGALLSLLVTIGPPPAVLARVADNGKNG